MIDIVQSHLPAERVSFVPVGTAQDCFTHTVLRVTNTVKTTRGGKNNENGEDDENVEDDEDDKEDRDDDDGRDDEDDKDDKHDDMTVLELLFVILLYFS